MAFRTACRPFTAKEKSELQFLYDEWAHPYFISKEEFVRLITDSGVMADVVTENWVDETLPSWRQSVWVGVESPWYVLSKLNLRIWWKVVRDIVCLERMHQAFKSGLMEYGACSSRPLLYLLQAGSRELQVGFGTIGVCTDCSHSRCAQLA